MIDTDDLDKMPSPKRARKIGTKIPTIYSLTNSQYSEIVDDEPGHRAINHKVFGSWISEEYSRNWIQHFENEVQDTVFLASPVTILSFANLKNSDKKPSRFIDIDPLNDKKDLMDVYSDTRFDWARYKEFAHLKINEKIKLRTFEPKIYTAPNFLNSPVSEKDESELKVSVKVFGFALFLLSLFLVTISYLYQTLLIHPLIGFLGIISGLTFGLMGILKGKGWQSR